ncbi:hypothetical protein EG68_02175 [Paragonimus skrjabini miyazakii]|uniref:Enoyl reductase (ER) domain-containing protein n=1 Tax=Paragonimus skrjabini miyazakii TaxID=59628 RepID=A0A8S9Z9F5_9TREM|nr:hypothetical protein EG68_02175 [Paragonimus skrjabini miyazakii]
MGESTETKQAEEQNAVTEEEKQVPQYRSVVLNTYGGSKHLRVESSDVKQARENEIEISVEACGVNFLDVMLRQGLIEQLMKPPFAMGSECAGIVTAVGEAVTEYKVGERVVVLLETGAWSERLIIPVKEEASKPDETKPTITEMVRNVILPWPAALSASQAAVLPFAYLPAYLLLHNVACVRTGDIILVHSAGGGVGTAIGQLAKLIPNVKLIGTASKTKHEQIASMYETLFTPDQDWSAEIKKLYPQGINVILDCLSGEEFGKSYSLLKPLGKYILYGMSNLVTGDRKNFLNLAKQWFQMERISPLRLHEENRILGGFSLKQLLFSRTQLTSGSTSPNVAVDLVRETWTELTRLVNSKSITPLVDSEWSFEEVKDAMVRLQERRNVGKVVLLPKATPKEPESTDTKKAT